MPNNNDKNQKAAMQKLMKEAWHAREIHLFYTLTEVAQMFNKTERTILNWRQEDKLDFIIENRRPIFYKPSTDEALNIYKRFGIF